jgi:hypothetical protein
MKGDNLVTSDSAIFRLRVIKYMSRSEILLCKNSSDKQIMESSVYKIS